MLSMPMSLMLTRGGSGNQCDCSNGHSGIPFFVKQSQKHKILWKIGELRLNLKVEICYVFNASESYKQLAYTCH